VHPELIAAVIVLAVGPDTGWHMCCTFWPYSDEGLQFLLNGLAPSDLYSQS